jgi:hypothetical protein
MSVIVKTRNLRALLRGWLPLGLILAGCGHIVDMGQNGSADPRRVYVNDVAANDSLPHTLIRDGLVFVLQPGKPYNLRLKTASAEDSLVFYVRSTSGFFNINRTIGSTAQAGGFRSFSLLATKTVADQYFVFLRNATGGRATLPDSVRLVPVDTTGAATVAVRLLMVRQLTHPDSAGYMTDPQKAKYARDFLNELRSVYAAYGLTVDADSLFVEPTGAPVTVSFNAGVPSIPGTNQRRANAINMYLVDRITSGTVQGTVLGFAPREAIDLSLDIESRVLLNVRGGSAQEMAVTAAHEMGHFLGLRHTTASPEDRDFDEDESNSDDGFASTPHCSELASGMLGKRAAQEITLPGGRGRPYCLRVAGAAALCDCPDASNLMFAYSCGDQEAMGGDQQKLVRNNLKLYLP